MFPNGRDCRLCIEFETNLGEALVCWYYLSTREFVDVGTINILPECVINPVLVAGSLRIFMGAKVGKPVTMFAMGFLEAKF